MDWDNYRYPAMEVEYYDGVKLVMPEARDHDVAILPHQHIEVDHFFPRALAVDDALETMEERDHHEVRGEALGRSLPPRRAARRDDEPAV